MPGGLPIWAGPEAAPRRDAAILRPPWPSTGDIAPGSRSTERA